jgi:2-iminobutanoate/2-iminopropanoate deaminase
MQLKWQPFAKSLFNKEEVMKKLTIVILPLITVLFFTISFSQTHEPDQAAVKKEVIKAPLGVPAGLPFSTAVKFGNTMYLSGLIGTDLKTSELVSPDVGEQTKQCMETLGLILRQAKMDYSDVVSCTVYLTDLNDYSEVNKAYSAYFPKDPPARTCVQVARLVREAKVELSFIAAK